MAIFVEAESQKGIVVGRAGAAIKALAVASRTDIEAFLGASCPYKKFKILLYLCISRFSNLNMNERGQNKRRSPSLQW